MSTELTRERETRPGKWVQAALDARALDDAHAAVIVGRSPTTIYRWRKGGIDFIAWIGLLNLIGLPVEWQPGHPVPKLPRDWKPVTPSKIQ